MLDDKEYLLKLIHTKNKEVEVVEGGDGRSEISLCCVQLLNIPSYLSDSMLRLFSFGFDVLDAYEEL